MIHSPNHNNHTGYSPDILWRAKNILKKLKKEKQDTSHLRERAIRIMDHNNKNYNDIHKPF